MTTSKLIGLAFAIAALLLASDLAFAAETCNPKNLTKSGTFTADTKSVGFLVSVNWGDGVLTFDNGETHKFHIIGGKLIETGFGETHLKGEVYNLNRVEDFNGVYYGSSSDSALVEGPKGGVVAKNSANCVYIHAESASEGVRLSPPAPGGVEIKLTD
jgi:hypothetical protein